MKWSLYAILPVQMCGRRCFYLEGGRIHSLEQGSLEEGVLRRLHHPLLVRGCNCKATLNKKLINALFFFTFKGVNFLLFDSRSNLRKKVTLVAGAYTSESSDIYSYFQQGSSRAGSDPVPYFYGHFFVFRDKELALSCTKWFQSGTRSVLDWRNTNSFCPVTSRRVALSNY